MSEHTIPREVNDFDLAYLRSLHDDELNDLMAECPVEPADFDGCMACAAYGVLSDRERRGTKPTPNLHDEIAELKEIIARVVVDGQIPEYIGSNRWVWASTILTETSAEPLDTFVEPAHAAIFEQAFESR